MNSTAILLLAAGGSHRFGSPKQLLKFRGKTLIHHSLEQLQGLPNSDLYVVLGAEIDKIAPSIQKHIIIENKNWESGMGSSIAAGMNLLKEQNYSQVLITLCDLPLIEFHHYQNLLDESRITQNIVATQYEQLIAVPVIFKQSYFELLSKLDADMGARQIILQNKDDLHTVSAELSYIDVDTIEDYEKLLTYE